MSPFMQESFVRATHGRVFVWTPSHGPGSTIQGSDSYSLDWRRSMYSKSQHWVPPQQPSVWDVPMLTLLQDTITGLLLAGIGHVNEKGKKNFFVVDSSVFKGV